MKWLFCIESWVFIQVIQYVTKLYTQTLGWSPFQPVKGLLGEIPKKVTKNCQDIDFTFDFYMSSVFQVVLCLQTLLCDSESFFGRRCWLVLFHHPAMKTRAALCVVTLPQSKDSNGTWCIWVIWGCILSYLSISYREQVMFHCHTFKHLLRMYLDPPNIPKTSSKIF